MLMNELRNSMNRNRLLLFIIALLSFSIQNNLYSQNNILPEIEKERHARIMFYNCENLFDSFDDSTTRDEEFLPCGERHWTYKKYQNKLNKTAQVIISAGGWEPVDLVGLCEIENKQVLNDLVFKSQLYLKEYQFIHKESPDLRGIDVALLYQPTSFNPIQKQFIEIEFSDTSKKSREIIYCKGVLHKSDTIHVFVNHWPSRWGGQLESETFRIEAAETLRKTVDSIYNEDSQANIIIMGDLNDTPNNNSIIKYLNAPSYQKSTTKNQLINVSRVNSDTKLGTHKHNGVWSILDQIIVSANLLSNKQALHTTNNSFTIINYDFLLEIDDKHLGIKPFRTFVGFKYNDGYSDHLPVFIDLYRR